MKFTLSWLKDHLETSATLTELTDALTDLGLEVEGVEDKASALRDFTVGYIKSAEKHPDADKLNVCQVETDEGDLQIICGAPNARAGIHVVVAKPGTFIPGLDLTIKVGKIRGVESYGMMCSEREMLLSEEHDGIIELENAVVGQNFADWLTTHNASKIDPVVEIAITPNRPDALGVRGIARDLAARGLGVLKTRDVDPVAASIKANVALSIDEDTRDGCPVFMGRVIRGVKNGPSPAWLQDALTAIGLRPINFLVDVTNFFTYDRNRPLHVFDLAKLEGDLRVHRALGGEDFEALDGVIYPLKAGQMVISDQNGPQSLAGIMGGLASGCDEATTDVFVESAYWDPVEIAYTGRALKINSDARYRFERGIDPNFTHTGLEHAVRMIVDHGGGSVSELVQAGEVPCVARAYKHDADRCTSLVGMEIPKAEQRSILQALGFEFDGDMAQVPSWRPDVQGEADLIEEVVRVASLTKLQGKPMPRQSTGIPKPVLTPLQSRERMARRTIASLGYNECVTYSFIDAKSAELFGSDLEANAVANPISQDLSHMRPDLLAGLLAAAARNQARGHNDLALFEVGAAFTGGEPGEQELMATGLMVGHSSVKDTFGTRRPVDVFDAKADVEAVLKAIGAPEKVQVLRDTPSWWHPGRSAKLGLGPKKILAAFGEIHPKVLKEMNVKGPAVGFTVWLAQAPFPRSTSSARPALHLNDLQAVERDFAFVVDRHVEALSVVNAAAGADKALIEEVRVFDEFIGGSLGEDQKSLAITVRLQPKDKTLTEKDIELISGKIVAKVSKATGGQLRD